jgi:hypothetical protein
VELYYGPNKWKWYEVLFEDLHINQNWGLQTWANVPFPSDQSMGIRFQVDETQQPFDIYLDDIILLRDVE